MFATDGAAVPPSLIERMCGQIVYRGPDAFGCHVGPYIGLGERRLAIIDLRETANPPLANEDQTVWIVFNGEIYNFQQLRPQLEADGHRFRTNADTEVVIHLYEKYGVECLQHLRGMFAFAIWDERRRVLFAARDRLGKKPLFYSKTARQFAFASSINALRELPEVASAEPDFRAIDAFLTHQYVPSPKTAFEGVCKLPAAHYLVCDTTGKLTIERYWRPPLESKTSATQREIESELLRLLREAVRLRLISDVPLGVFLSGGIDSTAVTALFAAESSRPVKTFSIGFEEDRASELPYARKLAERYQTDHHELIVRPSATEILPLLVRHFAEPFADSSAIPTIYVSQLARQHVTVALSGDGGDESFLGYDHYAATERWDPVDVIPYPLRRGVASTVEAALGALPFSDTASRMARAWHLFGAQLPERYATTLAMVKEEEKRFCYTDQFRSLLKANNGHGNALPLAWDTGTATWDWMARHDQHYYLPDCLMVKTDVASMANSLEVRCPFLDHVFVEFAATIPADLKRQGGRGKAILRNALRDLLPAEVLNKPKTGFGVPLAQWFRDDLSEMLRGVLLDETSAKRGLFRQKFLKRMIEDQITGKRDWSNRLWGFLFLELWFRAYVD